MTETPSDDVSRQIERGRIRVENEVGVRGEDDAVQLEGECVGIFVRRELALLERGDDEAADQRSEPALERGDLLLDRTRARAHLQDRPREEAPTRERVPHEVVEEGVAECNELGEPGAAARAGSMTSALKIRPASSTVASWRSCFEPKWA